MTSLSLTGKNEYNYNNLSGKKYVGSQNIPEDIKKIKQMVMNNLIIPLLSKQWNKLKENLMEYYE